MKPIPNPSDSTPPFDAIVHGGGAMGERIRGFDWSHHPLGPPESWPQSLKTVIRIMLTSRYAMWLGWGRELTFFCNDAYAPTLGIKQAWALGTPAIKVWAEIWESIGPRIESVIRTGNATWDESLRLFLERSGYAEETYHTFSYSPVPHDDGSIGGMLCVVTEDTDRVIGDRRLAILRESASGLAGGSTEETLFRVFRQRLAAHPEDLPFALLYFFEAKGNEARLACAHGANAGEAIAPAKIDLHQAEQVWPATAMLDRATSVVIDDLATRFASLPAGPWEKPPRQAAVVPIAQQGSETPLGFLVAGINPYRPLDAAYTGFLALLAGQISAALSNVRAYEAERKRAEALAELDRAKTAFFSNVSHELRTPLTLMLAPMEDLLRAPASAAPAELRELAGLAHRNGLRLLKLVNTILDFSRIEAGRMEAVFAPTDLAGYTAELASSFRAAIERAGLKLVVKCPPLPEPIHVDRDMWEKIVLNLLSNAFKFTLAGEIRATLRPVADGVEFAVQDTGVGIPADALPHVFERFYRVRGTAGRTFEGTGIGLALVHELVKFHSGTIRVESAPGVGTTFTVFLPAGRAHLPKDYAPSAAAADASASSASAKSMTASANSFGPWEPVTGETETALAESTDSADSADGAARETAGIVLVVDDNADMRRYVARLLSPRFETITAVDGVAALELVKRKKPDLILSDVMMPRLDGFGLLKAIRALPESRTIPVILLSARAGEESRVEGLDAGADDYLVKPFAARELLARVNVHLQMARIRGQAERRERELRTKAETFAEALRESGERLSASLAAAGTGTFRWDLAANRIDFDDSLNRLHGLPTSAPTRSLQEFLQLVHPEDRTRFAAACDRVLAEREGLDVEYRVALPDGATRWLHDKGQTFVDDAGKTGYMIGACVDISRRKRAETFVWRQKDVLEQIVAGAPLADVLETLTLDLEKVAERKLIVLVTMVDADGLRLRTIAGRRSPAGWSAVFDGAPIGLSGGSCGAAVFRQERVVVRDVMTSPLWEKFRADAVKRGLRACCSTPVVSSDGGMLGTFAIYYSDPSAPTEDEIRFVDIVTRTAAIAVERDRSELALKKSQAELAEHAQLLEARVQERTAQLQETISDLESFSYSISHDMRAPLRAMQSFAQLLAADCGDNIGLEGKDYIRRIVGASDRMDRLIQDVLTYSRVTRTELQLEPVDAEKVVDGILESYPQFQPPHAEIDVRRPLPRVMGNPAAFVQCMSNLIGNAIKFVPTGTVPRVEIWSELRDARVLLFVRDNGIGIEPEAHEKIFRIFYQLDRSFPGTGIGLSIVRKAAERMGGKVGLKSELHRGSTFHLELGLGP